jgi:hypothetical protein
MQFYSTNQHKQTTMIQEFFNGQFNAAMHFRLFSKLLKCCLAISITVYVLVHLILFDIPFEWPDEIYTLAKILLTGSIFASIISSIIIIADLLDMIFKKRHSFELKPVPVKRIAIMMLLLIAVVSACSAQEPATGMVKDITTGLSASYKNIKPGKVLLVMNDEIIHHTDIPLGESFYLVNNNIKGLTVKEGKVAVGCALTIKNKAGKTLLHSDDLFNRNDTFKKDSVSFLRCKVSTGNPMKWEEKYYVTVIFWDKYGTGRIENKVAIRCIDLP